MLLHGIGHRWQAWEPVFNRLARERDVIAIDLPGFGQSPPLAEGLPYTVDTVMDQLSAVFAELGLGRPHIAGNSLGGLFALEAADRGLVASATALSPAGFFDTAGRRRAITLLRAFRLGASAPGALLERLVASPVQRNLVFRLLYGRPHLVDADLLLGDAKAMSRCAGFEKVAQANADGRFTGSLRGDVPVTIAWGTVDRILPPSQALKARRQLPTATHVWLPGCGHVPMSDDPEMVAGVILRTSAAAGTQATAV